MAILQISPLGTKTSFIVSSPCCVISHGYRQFPHSCFIAFIVGPYFHPCKYQGKRWEPHIISSNMNEWRSPEAYLIGVSSSEASSHNHKESFRKQRRGSRQSILYVMRHNKWTLDTFTCSNLLKISSTRLRSGLYGDNSLTVWRLHSCTSGALLWRMVLPELNTAFTYHCSSEQASSNSSNMNQVILG